MAGEVQLINHLTVVGGRYGKGETWVITKQRLIFPDHPYHSSSWEKELYYHSSPQAMQGSPGLSGIEKLPLPHTLGLPLWMLTFYSTE